MKSKELLLCDIFCLFSLILIGTVEGRRCYRTGTRYVRQRMCCRWDWGHCYSWDYFTVTKYVRESYCCTGWKGSDCNTPICNPSCRNGGSCIQPNTCKCPFGHTGISCQTETCSHIKPCFPGTCISQTNCQCANGFRGGTCNSMTGSQQPHITHASATMKFIPRTGKHKNVLMYWFMADASNPNSTEIDHRWIHFKKFNVLDILVEAMYNPPNINTLPRYVAEYKFGIVSGNAHASISKVSRQGNHGKTLFDKTYSYNSISTYNPEENVARLNESDADFSTNIEHGDNLTITVTVQSGGYEKLKDLNKGGRIVSTTIYNGQRAQKTMRFHFDFEAPIHCSEDKTCPGYREPIHVGDDVTKNRNIPIRWDGWRDDLGGIFRYNLEFHHLKPDALGNLTEISKMEPFKSQQILKDNLSLPITFKPPGPGMYSIILDVADAANNSRFSRQFLLYDPISNITLDSSSKLYVSSAEAETHYLWQSNTQDENGQGSPITITWKGHFRNKFHEDNKLLNPINSFHTSAMDDMYLKNVDNKLDDITGRRTRKAIPNIHGIVSFQIAYSIDHNGGKTMKSVPVNGWHNVTNSLEETSTINVKRSDGDTVKFWVRANDIMGNTRIDSTLLNIDTTAPIVTSANLRENINSSLFNYGSRIVISTKDDDSGIHKIKWAIIDMDNGAIVKENSISGNKTKNDPGTLGSRTPAGEYYYYYHSFDINNCWMAVSKAELSTKVFNLTISVYNMAMLSTTKYITISNLTELDGMASYAGPMNLNVNKTYKNGVKLMWTPGYSCFEIDDILATYSYEDEKGKHGETMKIDKDAYWFNLIGLQQGINYTVKFVTKYKEDSSDPVYISFVTDTVKESKSNAAVIGGSIGGVLFLLLVIIIILILWRKRLICNPKRPEQKYHQSLPHIHQLDNPKVFNNKTYQTDNDIDDIYLYGGMKFDSTPAWVIPHSKIILEDKINSGRFADIFKARYDTKQNDMTVVVAKTLQVGFSEDSKLLMTAKINFFATQVGKHPNVINLIGAVTDNRHLGPYMVLEHCEEGNMRDWLLRKKEKITDDLIERLFQMILGIAKGMEYLSSKKIVHRRLAARNILLPFTLIPKVSGFGPSTYDESKDKNDITKERIPVKWMAPECTEWTRNATTKSDVWSFGIVMWEILSLGETPYGGISSRNVPDRIQNGYRLERPEYSADEHYRIMKRCWTLKQQGRPDFQDIVKELESTFKTVPSDAYYYDMKK